MNDHAADVGAGEWLCYIPIMSHTSAAPVPTEPILPEQLLQALRRAQAAVSEVFHAPLAAQDIRPIQHAVLHVLRRQPGLRQSEVSAALGVARTNFVPLFDALERRGLAERRDIEGDRRARGLFLTEAGAALLNQVDPLLATQEARLNQRLGTDGRHQLLALLGRLAESAFDPVDAGTSR
jgi:DNA-binding MarR family transcriptional regulator